MIKTKPTKLTREFTAPPSPRKYATSKNATWKMTRFIDDASVAVIVHTIVAVDKGQVTQEIANPNKADVLYLVELQVGRSRCPHLIVTDGDKYEEVMPTDVAKRYKRGCSTGNTRAGGPATSKYSTTWTRMAIWGCAPLTGQTGTHYSYEPKTQSAALRPLNIVTRKSALTTKHKAIMDLAIRDFADHFSK